MDQLAVIVMGIIIIVQQAMFFVLALRTKGGIAKPVEEKPSKPMAQFGGPPFGVKLK